MLLVLATVAALSTRAPVAAAPASTQSIASRTLTLNDRISAQRAIEEVYWRHRIWPKDNPAPRPSLDTLMPTSTIRAKVEDYLKKSNALESWWHRPITGEQLQAELDRMARASHDPKVLQELFDALHGDAYLIAETLARPVLAERLARNWFANDDRIHGALRARAEKAVAACHNVSCMKEMGGTYFETTEKLRRDGDTANPPAPTGRFSGLEETSDEISFRAVLSQHDGELVTATSSWVKESFDTWWKRERAKQPAEVASTARAFTLPALDPTGCTNDTWSATFTENPDPRYGHTAVWTGTEMIVWGGASAGLGLNKGGRYNPATDTWMPTSTGVNAPLSRGSHTAVWTGTEMIVWGGLQTDFATGNLVHLDSGARYDPASDTWTPTSTSANVATARAYHTAVWTGTEMIIWGGWRPGGLIPAPGARYRPASDRWVPMSGVNAPSQMQGHAAVWTGTEMITWGGLVYDAQANIGGRYDPVTDTWTATSIGVNMPSPRFDHKAVWTGTEMIVWGGQDPNSSQYLNSGGRYDPSTDQWTATSTATNVPSARTGHSAVWNGSTMIVWGGFGGGNTGAAYTPSTDTWVPAGTTSLTSRAQHTAIWTGSEMIIWGGRDGTVSFNTGGRYDPTSDRWVATSMGATVPSPRLAHSAVWTGTEMIVWGGQPSGGPPTPPGLNTGGRYAPATDSWIPTSAGAGLPASRVNHSAVWTGREMIVWGGDGASGWMNTGGRYNPDTDSWSPTSTGANVPPALYMHAAVWTGHEMIVWGVGLADVRTGARYDPLTDSWRSMSTGPPTPRPAFGSSSVWTGTEMIVWGTGPDPGGRYNPSSDSWAQISTGSNAPNFRYGHAIVWSGTEVIVQGGCCDNNTGGRYNPSTDSWQPTSTGANVPSYRQLATGVWTGSEMIVFGGGTGDRFVNPMNAGGRYDPATDTWASISMGPDFPDWRVHHTAVWTGTEMIVWGGDPGSATGARYCACPAGRLVYRDADGDGLGDAGQSIGSCDGTAPAGYVLDHTDCNDAIANTSADIDNDGEPDACDLNDGLIYEWRNDKTSVSWQAEQGPTSWNVYVGDLDVLRVTGEYTQVPGSNALAGRQCGLTGTVATEIGTPAPGKGSYSLVTGVTNGVEGSLGSSSFGPRPNANSCP